MPESADKSIQASDVNTPGPLLKPGCCISRLQIGKPEARFRSTQGDVLMQQPDVRRRMRVRQTDWGDAVRIDLNQLGARLPSQEKQGATWSEATSEALRDEWSESQNEALCDTMMEVAARWGGTFDSFAEWTVLHNKLYDGTHMRDVRRARFSHGYRAAITTLGWAHPKTRLSTCIQAVGYVPKAQVTFEQAMWRPESLYDTEFMALAPAVVTRFGGGRHVHLSGVVAWDEEINPLFEGQPERQISRVFDLIEDVFQEAGGSLADVVRLRPFAHCTRIAGLIRAEVSRRWAGYPRPVVMMSDSRRFGDPPRLYAEIQVMGVMSDGHSGVRHSEMDLPAGIPDEGATRIRFSRARDWELIQVGELRAPPGTDPNREAEHVTGQMAAALERVSLTRSDICLTFAYVSSPEAATAFQEAVTQAAPMDTVHVLPCPAMPELEGRRIKVEMTARRRLAPVSRTGSVRP